MQYGTVQCSAVQYSVLQRSTVQYIDGQCSTLYQGSTVQYITVQCSAVQCSAACQKQCMPLPMDSSLIADTAFLFSKGSGARLSPKGGSIDIIKF
jgi:hypothetical protein